MKTATAAATATNKGTTIGWNGICPSFIPSRFATAFLDVLYVVDHVETFVYLVAG